VVWYSPWAFLLFIPLLAVFLLPIFKKKSKEGIYVNQIISSTKAMGLKTLAFYAAKLLYFLSLSLLILALARPQEQKAKANKTLDGIDIVITLDISESMMVEDMEPVNRLEASKKIIEDFISKRTSDRIGLVVFSGESYTRVPLTLDYKLLVENLKKVEISKKIKGGTAIGVALANAVARLKTSTAKSKVVIFLTDGENNSGVIPPNDAIEIAKLTGVKIYSVGMGKDGQTRIPRYFNIGRNKVKRYISYNSKVNEALLKKMANETGGLFYRASTSDALESVFESINQLERSKIEASKQFEYKELYSGYLVLSFLLLVLAFLLSPIYVTRWP